VDSTEEAKEDEMQGVLPAITTERNAGRRFRQRMDEVGTERRLYPETN